MSDIYTQLFNISNENMIKSGATPYYSLKTLQYLIAADPFSADIQDLSNEEEREVFIEKCYIALLNRLPLKGEYEEWESQSSLPIEDFKRGLIKSLINSEEFAAANIKLYNNIYSEDAV